ncbi:hypothetical protein LZ198_07360 [Myxococcus sp. K15C18031901]|uniref:hypothetical protein n=1 Tax=Myxococcus dinghuensis TaxID=2906761 RepID=UPI0020A6E640|nr:hypothetical protein [Myxococcus dinghuensis]MCP3098693.1 hypothetical protein [Myxococcus dinghuensis]
MSRLLGVGLLLLSLGCGGGRVIKPGDAPSTGASVLVGNVGGDGGGFIILPNGKLKRIPPWTGPLAPQWLDLLSHAVLLSRLESPKTSEEQDLRRRVEARLVGLSRDLTHQLSSRPGSVFETEAIHEVQVLIYVSPGVANDGGGFVITASGRIIKIPPRGPASLERLLEVTRRLQVALEPRGKPQPDPWRPLFDELEFGLSDTMRALPAELQARN